MTGDPFEGGVALPHAVTPSVNERVQVGGHYMIVLGVPRGIRVSCPDCGLHMTFLGVPQDEGGGDQARDLVDRILRPFVDKTCDGVRAHLLAEAVMES